MFETELATLAGKLPRGPSRVAEEPVYDLISDAFVWNDELIDFQTLSQGEAGAMRCLWRYRTSLVTGVQDGRFKELWTRATVLAPSWVGFTEGRDVYSENLAQKYRELKSKGRNKGQRGAKG